MAIFSEKRLNVSWGLGVSGGPEFSTTEVVSASGFVFSNAQWIDDVFSIDIGNRVIVRAEKDYLVAFFKNRKGKNQGFRFKNWSDYKGTDELIGVGNGTATQYQLFKNYTAEGDTTSKKITKPITGTLSIKINGVTNTNWSCDYTTGIVTFNAAPGNGLSITASFEFDLPVKFGVDKFELTYIQENESGVYQMGSLPIREVPV